jgi:inner membrane transporter RhtA
VSGPADARVESGAGTATPWAIAALMAAMVSFQVGAMVAKRLFVAVGAEGTTAYRLFFGALLLLVIMRPWRRMPARADWRPLIAYGVVLGCMNMMFYLALRTVPLGIAVALEFLGPLAVASASLRRIADAAWLGLAVVGLVLLLPIRGGAHAIDPFGAMLALGAGACWAAYIIAGQKVGRALGPFAVAHGTIIAALIAVPVGIAHAGTALLDVSILPLALLLGLLSSGLPYVLEMVALTSMPARAYGTLTSLEPAIGSLIGLAFLHEALAAGQWIGIAAIVVASAGTAASTKSVAKPVADPPQ